MIDEAIEGKISANWRFVDGVFERIQDQNCEYLLEKLGTELRRAELEQKARKHAEREAPPGRRVQIDS